jgi:aromatic-L-amino-acid decarboxylase
MSEHDFVALTARAAEWIAAYRARLPGLPVLPVLQPGDVAAHIPAVPPEKGESADNVLADLDRLIVPGLTHWNHPGFLAYFSSSTTDAGIVAELLAAELNQNAMLWRTSPAGTELEERMIEWIRHFVGLPDGFEGVIQDTASTSSFVALIAARERAVPDVRRRGLAGREDLGPAAMYMSEQAHSSLEKAAIAAGLGLDHVHRIPVDQLLRMKPSALAAAIETDRRSDRTPVMVCATIGTTSSNAVDPVHEIAAICRDLDVWLHVDAAYAGPAAALPEKRAEFEGWDDADSIVLNPHKWMATPIDCSVLLYRDRDAVRRSLALTPEYLRSEEGGTDLMDVGLALGRRFRSLKLWFLFRSMGTGGLRDMLRWHIELADRAAAWLDADPRFDVVAPHPFSLVCFRARSPDGANPDDWNRRLMHAVNARGPVFLSHTAIGGRFTLRLAVGSARVTADAVGTACRLLGEEHDRLAGAG